MIRTIESGTKLIYCLGNKIFKKVKKVTIPRKKLCVISIFEDFTFTDTKASRGESQSPNKIKLISI
jgi:hypothetical protein